MVRGRYLFTLHSILICDLSRENVQQRFSVERLKPLATRWVPLGYPLEALVKALKALEKLYGFFLYLLKALKKAVGKFLPNHWKKPLGSFPLPVESIEKSRWENLSYPLLHERRKLTYLRFRLGVCNQSSVNSNKKNMKFGSPTEQKKAKEI